MKTYFVVTIDTEIDSPKWKPTSPLSLRNIKAISRLQDLFKRYKVKPTYLLTFPVATCEESIDIFKEFLKKKEIEIGAHLHPWTNPPFSSEKEKFKLGYPHHSQSEFKKLANLTEVIETSFGKRPVSYRAGRYGFDEESLEYLERLGYLVDASITPSINWERDGGPNFIDFTQTQPYFLDPKNIKESGQSSVLEVPLSIIFNRDLSKFSKKVYNNLPLALKFILKKTGLIKPIWLRPSISSFEEMKFLCDFLIISGEGVLNMMFHSNELTHGTSPYIKTPEGVEDFFLKLEKILDYLILQKKIESKTLFELYKVKAVNLKSP